MTSICCCRSSSTVAYLLAEETAPAARSGGTLAVASPAAVSLQAGDCQRPAMKTLIIFRSRVDLNAHSGPRCVSRHTDAAGIHRSALPGGCHVSKLTTATGRLRGCGREHTPDALDACCDRAGELATPFCTFFWEWNSRIRSRPAMLWMAPMSFCRASGCAEFAR